MVLSLPVRFLFASLVVVSSWSLTWQPTCRAETVLLDFISPMCSPCQKMRPVVQRLKADGLPVREIDISREPQTAAHYGVTHVPTFLVVVDGKPVDRIVGETSYRRLHRMLRNAMPAAPPRQRHLPQGQSPEVRNTFETQPAGAAAAVGSPGYLPTTNSASANNLSQPQAGRVISLQNPNARPSKPVAPANPFGKAPTRPPEPTESSPNSLHQRLLTATVKIAVDDPEGKSAGTGTIVDSRSGEALILTCGHIFRSSGGKGEITITTFHAGPAGASPAATYVGRLIDFDLERDLALVSMRTTAPVQAVAIAGPNDTQLSPNTTVTSVGCNHGQNPTAIDSRVTSIDRYQGTPNVEVAGAPVEGRSGGGLFNARGQLVGVCYAADQQGNEGLYVSLPAIYTKLDSLNLNMVYQRQPTTPQVAQVATANTPPQLVDVQPPVSIRGQEPEPPSFPATRPALSATEQAALREIQSRGAKSEIICIIRPQDPTAKSEVITLNDASPGFVQALKGSAVRQATAMPPNEVSQQ
ncbi:MAG: trypsin-like peptidase domain-containing protein [Bythopirellula sp.]